ncbi:MAG: ribonuclease Z [Dysgonamonadaceae bacterium]|nr:ribonuclease Z [Dysgonamonadaceae bacterium]
MESFELNILGCGAAIPTTKHYLTSQIISLKNKLYMIDCGEGTQLQFRKMKLNFRRLEHIFISHLHGDHCLGLPGLISTFGLLGRTSDLYIHAQSDAEKIFRPILDHFCREIPYKVIFNSFSPFKKELIFENRSLSVHTIPLKHRIPTVGFLFEEKAKSPHIIREMIEFHQVPVKQINRIKAGEDFITEAGDLIPNKVFVRPADPSVRYAYCSDTAYFENIIPIIKDIDLLYHESTFTDKDIKRAKETFHSSAAQAAMIAKQANVKKLVLGHFSARYPDESVLLEEARTIFPDTILASEYLKLKI